MGGTTGKESEAKIGAGDRKVDDHDYYHNNDHDHMIVITKIMIIMIMITILMIMIMIIIIQQWESQFLKITKLTNDTLW